MQFHSQGMEYWSALSRNNHRDRPLASLISNNTANHASLLGSDSGPQYALDVVSLVFILAARRCLV